MFTSLAAATVRGQGVSQLDLKGIEENSLIYHIDGWVQITNFLQNMTSECIVEYTEELNRSWSWWHNGKAKISWDYLFS